MQPEGTEETGAVQEEPLEETQTPEVEASDAPEVSEEVGDESVRDTVERALKEEKAKLSDGPEGAPETDKVKVEFEAKKPVKKAKKEQVNATPEEIRPPDRFTAQEKELFNTLPPEMRKPVADMVLDHERKFTQAMQEARKYEGYNRGIIEAVTPYADEWAERGFTVPQAIAALAAANRKLLDPNTRVQAYKKLGADMGITPEMLSGEGAPAEAASAQVENHPVVKSLLTKLQELESREKAAQEQHVQQTADGIVAEIRQVQDEKDEYGRYRYPKLHEDAFLQQVKPLVSVLRQTVPGLSWGDAFRRAYATIEGQQGNLSQPNQTRLPASNTNTRALSAAVSVRGRAAPGTSGTTIPENIPDSPRDTVKMVLEQLRRG